MRVLVVEDERKVGSFIRQGLEEEGYVVELAADGAAAMEMLAGPAYDLIVLDLMLPKADGFAVLRELRRRRLRTPTLIVTARDEIVDRVTGLDLGADDYLTKPFSFDEFLARVRALLRRGGLPGRPALVFEDLTLDPATRMVKRGGVPIALTAREFDLLAYFMQNPGRVLTRHMIAAKVWPADVDPVSNAIDVCVSQLRHKLRARGAPPLLRTARGLGYVLGREA
jgi:DNA-binding response OmpR family regulator